MDPYPRVAFALQGLVPRTMLQDHMEDSILPSLTPSTSLLTNPSLSRSPIRELIWGVVSPTLGRDVSHVGGSPNTFTSVVVVNATKLHWGQVFWTRFLDVYCSNGAKRVVEHCITELKSIARALSENPSHHFHFTVFEWVTHCHICRAGLLALYQ